MASSVNEGRIAGVEVVVGMVAGEASGDLLGSQLIAALRELLPQIKVVGIGGPRMEAAGMDVWVPMEKLAVRGYAEVIKHLPEILSIRRQVRSRLIELRPAAFIGIDAPDFNLALESALKRNGIPTAHYVSPAIWMWRKERIHKIKRAVNKMLTLFPFEEAIYQDAGIDVAFVGHPLADILAEVPDAPQAREQLKLPAKATVITLMPGSRQSELLAMADVFIETAKLINQQLPDAMFLAPMISRETRDLFEQAIYRNHGEELPIKILFGHAHEAMAAADIVLLASGTATLEAALLCKPMVITYKMPPASYWWLKGKGYLPYYGLPNILAGKFVVPEFIQDDASAENLSRAVLNLLDDTATRAKLRRKFSDLNASLQRGAAHHAARAVMPLLQGIGIHRI